jgi:hypothetical protein
MSLKVDASIGSQKNQILDYLRARASEHGTELVRVFGESQVKKRASGINKALNADKVSLLAIVRQTADREKWNPIAVLEATLMLMHCTNVVMIEKRNEIWPYEYMAFSRRIGELWEPFVTTCFDYPIRSDVALFNPPLFKDVKKRLSKEVKDFIQKLNLSASEKESLIRYYDQVWQLVSSGEIKLELDLHFAIGQKRFVADCKSGFGSNEKGNTNRLLLVASVYKNIEPEDYTCMILVRSLEELNNHYLQTLKRSGLWEVYCGHETYPKVAEYSGFDLGDWIIRNISWQEDLEKKCVQHLAKNDLLKYLTW